MPNLSEQDKEFAQDMIKHHRDALKMATMYIDQGTNNKLLDLAERIISAQTKEIDFLLKLLK